MFPQFNFKALAVGSMLFAAGSMAAPTNETDVALVDIPIPTTVVKDWKISATMDTTESWTKYQSMSTEVRSTAICGLPTMTPTVDDVVNVTLPEAAAAAAVAAAQVASENGADVDPNHNLAFVWGFSADTYQHPPAPGSAPDPNVQVAAAADSGDDSAAPAAAASSAPAKNKYPTSPAGGIVEWFKSIFDFVTGRTYWKAHRKHKEEVAAKAAKDAAAKAQAEADAANAENVSEEWTFDDPDYNGDQGDMVDEGARRMRLFRA